MNGVRVGIAVPPAQPARHGNATGTRVSWCFSQNLHGTGFAISNVVECESREPLVRVTGHSGNPPGQGPFMKVTLGVSDGLIREATYETYQCPGCVACGKAITELVNGKTLEAAKAIDYVAIVARVGPLEPHRRICYGLALLALADALTGVLDQKA